ncbi:MAG TPA: 5-oxoprolinase/urea amidolyase family protein, partial [Vicinamibacterales bacterium]
PGGSVGIAGSLTGVYPRPSPGGWALLGRTSVPMFDLLRGCLVRPGDRVRFLPMGQGNRLEEMPASSPSPQVPPTDPVATVIRPGLLTTVQDAGRWGHQGEGVPVGGALDAPARRLANAAIGNAPDAAVLEATLPGLDLLLDRDCTMAVAGADLGAELDGTPMPLGLPVAAAAGAHVRLTKRRAGTRAYLALAGGLDVPVVLGSRSTELGAGFGGFEGRALRAGDRLAVTRGTPSASGPPLRRLPLAASGTDVRLRVLLGPHDAWFTPAAFEALEGTRFQVTPHSNRVGYRLQGDVPLARARAGEMISDATVIGGLQVPPDGQPILLMADRQVTGGYPIIAAVITADLPAAGQLAPGDWVRFAVCARSEALAALREVGGA